MKVADFLERHSLTGSELSRSLGFTGAEAVNSRRRKGEDIPEAWYPKLKELGYDVDGGSYTPPPTDDAEELFRDQAPPSPPDDARYATPATTKIDYASVAGHIEGAYKLAAHFAIAQADPLLANIIEEHAQQAGQAWAHYIQSEPRVAALVERMMIGTPLGEVIGVHVGIVFSYTVARASARSIAAQYDAERAAETAESGTAEPPTADDLAAATG